MTFTCHHHVDTYLINMDSMPNTSIESFVVLESFAVLAGDLDLDLRCIGNECQLAH